MADAQGEVPKKIGDYQIVRRLGSGVMGEVFMGTSGANVYHAVKVVNLDVAEVKADANKFIRDIVDDNIMQYKKIISGEEGKAIVVADYLEVRPVSRRVVSGMLSPRVLDLFATVCKSLGKAHSQDVIHGNVKSSNILVRRAGGKTMAIVSDFGLSYVYDKNFFTGPVLEAAFPYMAPERMDHLMSGGIAGSLTPACDIYSVCCVIYEALTGRKPFSGAREPDEILKMKETMRYVLLGVNSPSKKVDIKRLGDVLRRGLNPDPKARFRNMQELATELASCRMGAAA